MSNHVVSFSGSARAHREMDRYVAENYPGSIRVADGLWHVATASSRHGLSNPVQPMRRTRGSLVVAEGMSIGWTNLVGDT